MVTAQRAAAADSLLPRLSGHTLARPLMPRFLKRILRKREFQVWSVDESADGYAIDGRLLRRSDIVEIVAFKRDLITEDQVCIAIRHGEEAADGGRATDYIVEDNPCFHAVICDLEKHFVLTEGWWKEVVDPAFETNLTTIWSRNK